MAYITNIKVITRNYMIEGDNYYLIRFNIMGLTEEEKNRDFHPLSETMFGTLDHNFVDDDGKLKKEVALIHLFAGLTIAEAIKERNSYYESKRLLDQLIAEGKLAI